MTVQVTVRIADDAATFLDEQVRATQLSRAAIVTRALRREARRLAAERDAEIYLAEGQDAVELDAGWSRANAAYVAADLD